jgi:Mg2+/Co2+ transporter CorB
VEYLPPGALVAALILLIFCSAFFAMAETALMSANRFRLRSLAKRGHKAAETTLWLLDRTERLLSLILVSNTVVNTMATALATAIAIMYHGYDEVAIAAAIVLVALALIVFGEIAPKFIGARYPETLALAASRVLKPLLAVADPVIALVNLVVAGVLRLLRVQPATELRPARLSSEELRAIVLEGGNFIPQKHKSILLNLFDLEHTSVEDIMTPRAQVEALNLAVPVDELKAQLTTCYHNKLPVYEGEINQIVGILHVRHAVALLNEADELSTDHFRELLTPPYYIPQDTSALTQLQYFQENKERLGIIVDEYGEVQGLVTLDDIIEEMIGEFTTTMPGAARSDSGWDARGECLVEGSASLRDLNKKLGLDLPLDGPKTLNGLVLERLQDIPDAPIALKIGGVVVEVMQVQNQAIKVARLFRPAPRPSMLPWR